MNREFKSVIRSLFPRRVKKHRILGGPLRGGRIVTSWHDYPAAIVGRTERELIHWFFENVRPGETWLDIGAHYGYTAIALSRLVGESGRVFAFEPLLSTSGCLTETRRLNRFSQLIVVPFGLSAPETLEMKTLPITRGMVDSTMGSGETKEQNMSKRMTWVETITVARLDWLWARICEDDQRVHGIKIDVQGMEIDVLRGMENILRQNKPKLVVELHKGVDRKVFLNLIELSGYLPIGVPVETSGDEREPRYIDNRSYAFLPKC